jgi:hypothetical protein
MVLTQYRCDRQVRLSLRGPAAQLEPIGAILATLFPGEVLVSSDEDDEQDLNPDQIEVLEAMADHHAALACWQPAPC